MPVYLPIVIVLTVLVPVLVYFEIKKQKKPIYIIKPVCTLLIITAALLSLTLPGHSGAYTFSIVLGLILGSIAEIGFVQSMLAGATYRFPMLRLFHNKLSWILIGMVVASTAWPYFAAYRRRGSHLKQAKEQNE